MKAAQYTLRLLALAFCAAGACPALAQDEVAELIVAKRCNACHDMSAASLGPPWQAIAVRHAPRKDLMIDVLASKIVHGGGGNWGNVPMVPNQRVSSAQARRIAAWILNLSSGN